jgi:hypothetical protein
MAQLQKRQEVVAKAEERAKAEMEVIREQQKEAFQKLREVEYLRKDELKKKMVDLQETIMVRLLEDAC